VGDYDLSKGLIFWAVDNRDGDKLTLPAYNYDKGRPQNRYTTTPRMSQPGDQQLEELKEILAEAEDLCIEFAIAMRREAQRSWPEVERLSKELDDLAARRAERTKQP
jgi:hypothetical protein